MRVGNGGSGGVDKGPLKCGPAPLVRYLLVEAPVGDCTQFGRLLIPLSGTPKRGVVPKVGLGLDLGGSMVKGRGLTITRLGLQMPF